MTSKKISGGCQCGAVRFSVESFGRASICHCRMCQKAFGGFYAPLVTGYGLTWTRGKPAIFASSNKVNRGFCSDCGTPLTYDYGDETEIAIGALDNPELAPPTLQVNPDDMLSFVDGLGALPFRDLAKEPDALKFMAGIRTHQHPDHDTDTWPENQT